MKKIVLPVLLSGIIIIAGIFAFIPIDKATTVHTTIQTTIQNTQLNNIASAFQTDMAANASATCGSGSSFLVYFTFSNDTKASTSGLAGLTTILGIDDKSGNVADITVTLALGNQTSVSGVIGGDAGETIRFFGNSTIGGTSGDPQHDDVGDLAITVLCRSTDSASALP